MMFTEAMNAYHYHLGVCIQRYYILIYHYIMSPQSYSEYVLWSLKVCIAYISRHGSGCGGSSRRHRAVLICHSGVWIMVISGRQAIFGWGSRRMHTTATWSCCSFGVADTSSSTCVGNTSRGDTSYALASYLIQIRHWSTDAVWKIQENSKKTPVKFEVLHYYCHQIGTLL